MIGFSVHLLIDFHVQISFQQIYFKYSIQLFEEKSCFEVSLLMTTLFLTGVSFFFFFFPLEIDDYYQELIYEN